VLLTQNYPNYEVIVADDRSEDGTDTILKNYCQQGDKLKTCRIEKLSTTMPAKKHALKQAIEVSKGEILCFTDADCLPTKSWLSSVVSCFSPTTGIVVGSSPYDGSIWSGNASYFKGWLDDFVGYDELSGSFWAAAGIGLKRPWLCTGRNLAYRREVYDAVGGFEKIKHSISGDDDLFLLLASRTTSWEVRYIFDRQSFVRTIPPKSFRYFWQQRLRHFSAGRHFPKSLQLAASLFHLSNVVLLAGLAMALMYPHRFMIGFWFYFVKIIVDYSVYALNAVVFNRWNYLFRGIILEVLKIFYNFGFTAASQLFSFEWKTTSQS